jgi:hypothetical protein
MKQIKCRAVLCSTYGQWSWAACMADFSHPQVTRAGASNESGALEVTCDRREELEAGGWVERERSNACPTPRVKRGAGGTRPSVALGLMKAGKPSQRGRPPLAIRSPLGSCTFRFIVPLNLPLAQHTLNTNNSLLLLSASYTYSLHFTPYSCNSISALDSRFSFYSKWQQSHL